MKKLCLISILFFLKILIVNATPIKLLDAIKTNSVLMTARGNSIEHNPSQSSHTGKCLRLTLKNPSKNPQEYIIEAAYHFTCVESSKQDVISTETISLMLAAGQEKDILINALCCEKYKGSPNANTNYNLSYQHDGSILKLSNLLNAYKYFDNTAQQSLWCLTDQNDLKNIYDTDKDTVIENILVHFIANEKNIPIPPRYYQPKRTLLYPLEFEGSHTEFIETKTTIGFYITDSSNHIYSTIIDVDTETRRGEAKYSYLYRGQYPIGKYYLKMKKNQNWVIVREVMIP